MPREDAIEAFQGFAVQTLFWVGIYVSTRRTVELALSVGNAKLCKETGDAAQVVWRNFQLGAYLRKAGIGSLQPLQILAPGRRRHKGPKLAAVCQCERVFQGLDQFEIAVRGIEPAMKQRLKIHSCGEMLRRGFPISAPDTAAREQLKRLYGPSNILRLDTLVPAEPLHLVEQAFGLLDGLIEFLYRDVVLDEVNSLPPEKGTRHRSGARIVLAGAGAAAREFGHRR